MFSSYEKSHFIISESDGENSPEIQGALDELEPTDYLIMKKNVCVSCLFFVFFEWMHTIFKFQV